MSAPPGQPTAPDAPAHVRAIRIEAVEAGRTGAGRFLRVRGLLEDRRPRGAPAWIAHDGDVIHRMEVVLTVSHPDLLVTAIEGRMGTVPYPPVCPDALPSLQSLVGVSVARGFTRAVNERIGRAHGCAHVTALVLAMGPVVRQGAGAAFGFDDGAAGADDGRPPADPWFVDSCQAWRADGPLHRAWLRDRGAPPR